MYVPHDKQKIQGKEKEEMDKRFLNSIDQVQKMFRKTPNIWRKILKSKENKI